MDGPERCRSDTALAVEQWETLRATYVGLGHRVDLISPVEGLPDMVFAANGGVVLDGKAIGARASRTRSVSPRAPAYRAWFDEVGLRRRCRPASTNEGEGDFLASAD